MADNWVDVGPSSDLDRGPRPVVVRGRSLVVWRTAAGRLSALDDECPHQGTALSAGTVEGESLRCATHGYHVETDGWCDRAGGATRSYVVEERTARLWVQVAPPG